VVGAGLCTKKMPDLFFVDNHSCRSFGGERLHDFDTVGVRFSAGATAFLTQGGGLASQSLVDVSSFWYLPVFF
jgi:hypothetical protein